MYSNCKTNYIIYYAYRNWLEAVKWYSGALETPSDTSDTNDTSCQATEAANPDYIITARLAEMYRSDGHQLERNPNQAGKLYSQAADVAMANMKGKLANRYYMLAEEAWAEVYRRGGRGGGRGGGGGGWDIGARVEGKRDDMS